MKFTHAFFTSTPPHRERERGAAVPPRDSLISPPLTTPTIPTSTPAHTCTPQWCSFLCTGSRCSCCTGAPWAPAAFCPLKLIPHSTAQYSPNNAVPSRIPGKASFQPQLNIGWRRQASCPLKKPRVADMVKCEKGETPSVERQNWGTASSHALPARAPINLLLLPPSSMLQ